MTNPQLRNPNPTLAAPIQQIDRTYVRFGRTRLSYFGGCDYFRLSTHPALRRALLTGLKKFGLTVSASRSTTGDRENSSDMARRETARYLARGRSDAARSRDCRISNLNCIAYCSEGRVFDIEDAPTT